MSVKIFAMTHKKFDVPGDAMYIPLHVGHKNAAEDFGYPGDDTGDNISDLNCYYAELSGVYWVWKNYRDADCVGGMPLQAVSHERGGLCLLGGGVRAHSGGS